MSKVIESIIKKLEGVRDTLAEELDKSRARYDKHSERWFETDAAIDAEEAIDTMEEASGYIEDAIDCLGNVE